MGKKIKAAKIVDLGPRAVQKFGAVNDEREALRPADRDIEAIRVEQEFRAARRLHAL